jgi:hypothetical protein
MASAPLPVAPLAGNPSLSGDAVLDMASQRAIFTLLAPIKAMVGGEETEVHGLDMRAFDAADLPLLDQYRGQPIALAQNLVAALCDIAIDQVRQLDLEDFAMLASDALWQVDQVAIAMGLPAGFFLQAPAAGEQD